MAAEAAGPPALRLCCLRLVASELLQAQEAQGGSAAAAAASGSLHAAVRALPSELQQELLLLLASWQLLDDASCEALAGPGGGGVLAGAAAASLAHCVLLGRPGLGRLFPSPLPQLQSLSLKGLLFLEDGDVAMVVQHLPALRQLDLSKNPRFTAGAVGAVAAAPAAPQLQSLSLAGCWQVDALPGLAERCRALTSLTLAGCWQLTNSVVRRVLSAMPGLEELSLAGCMQLDSRAMVSAWLNPPDASGRVRRSSAEEAAAVMGEVLLMPTEGVVLPQLRSLDVSGTDVCSCLLLWLAQRSCGRLQKLSLGSSNITDLGLSALLLAKRALLFRQQQQEGQQQQQQRLCADVLPLLELSAGGTAAFGARDWGSDWESDAFGIEARWEEELGGGLPVHLPPPCGPQQPSQPLLRLSLLAPPPDAASGADAGAAWPPGSPAEVLAALGPAGLAQLQVLDASGSAGTGALMDVVATHCRSLQRLRLAGCMGLSDGSLEQVLLAAPLLRELDVSGCTGAKVSRPGSRFLRHKAPRLQEGGITDASLCLLARPSQRPSAQEAGPQQGPQQPASAAEAAGQGGDLRSLNAGGLSITDALLAALPGSLTALALRNCKRVNDSGLLQLLHQCPRLERLDASGCSQISSFGCHIPFGSSQAPEQQQQQQQQQQPPEANSPHGDGPLQAPLEQPPAEQRQMERRLQAFRCAVTTAAGVQLQRASLPKKACTPAALAWLAGQAHPASSSASAGGSDAAWRSGPLGAPPLQRLELASCSVLEENDLAALACCCPQLKSLQLPVAGAAAGSALCSALTQRCRLLTRLTLGSAAGLAEADLALLLRELPALQHLDCSGASGISGAAFTEHVPPARAAPPATQAGQAPVAAEAQAGGAAATAAPAAEPPSAQRRELVLRSLRLDGCNPSNTDVSAIVAACPHLEVLSLRDCRRLTLDTAHVALPSSRNLRQLLLRGAQKVVLGPAPPYGSRPSRALSLVELPLLDPADQQLWVAYICRPSPWVKLQFV